jgi:hypothetical protein
VYAVSPSVSVGPCGPMDFDNPEVVDSTITASRPSVSVGPRGPMDFDNPEVVNSVIDRLQNPL